MNGMRGQFQAEMLPNFFAHHTDDSGLYFLGGSFFTPSQREGVRKTTEIAFSLEENTRENVDSWH